MLSTVHGVLREAAAAFGGRTAIRDDSRSLTFSDWWRASLDLAARLGQAGVRQGDSVGVLCGKTVLLPVSFAAVSLAGARFLALSPGWPETTARRVHPPSPRSFTLAFDGIPPALRRDNSLRVDPEAVLTGSREPSDLPVVDPGSDFYLNVTSASTGIPKVAPVSHGALLANTRGVCSALRLTGDDVHMSLFSAAGHPHELFMRGLLLGGSTILTEGRYPRSAIRLMVETGVTALMGLPPQLEGLARFSGRESGDLSGLRFAEAGGMYSSRTFIDRFNDLAGVDVIQVWGSTETSGVALFGERNSDCLSGVVEGYEALIADHGTEQAGEGCPGELLLRGEAVVRGYLGDRTATDECFRDGWFRTGDMFVRNGREMRFAGRRGGLVKSAGLKVFPLEVELAILRHPDVLDTAVAGEDLPGRGETTFARVVLRPGRELGQAALRAFLRGVIDEYKIPHTIAFVPDLPRTPGGKLDRAALGRPPGAPDWRGELLRTDVEIVRLLCHRAETAARAGAVYDPAWMEEQLENATGHNPGPLSDDSVREMFAFIINTLSRG